VLELVSAFRRLRTLKKSEPLIDGIQDSVVLNDIRSLPLPG
jgi:hypothetical protein